MKFLVALYNRETARQNLQFAALFASRLSTDLTVFYVEPGVKRSVSPEIQLAREKMSEWEMASGGLEVLREARDHLASMGLINPVPVGSGHIRRLIAGQGGDFLEYPGCGSGIQTVRFRYREGDSLEEIISELGRHHHEVLVMGAGGNNDFLSKLLKFSPCSVLIVKNPQDIRYRLLVATDGTPPAHRAELLAIRTAGFLKMELTFLAIVKTREEEEFMKKHLERMSGVAAMKRVEHRTVITRGDIVRTIDDTAGEDHIIFLGRSRRGALAKLLFGSKTIQVATSARCPLLVVK